MESSITLNGKIIDLQKEGIIESISSVFEKSVIDLVLRWRSSTSKFTFQTSGSTGTPKKIAFTKDQLKSSARLTIQALKLEPNQTSLVCLDARYIAGQMMVIRSLENEMNIVAVEPSADPLSQLSDEEKIDFAAFVPYQLHSILQSQSSSKKLSNIKSVIIGGAPLDENIKCKLQTLNCSVYATYGMTETITHIALQKLNGDYKQFFFKAFDTISLSLDERNCLIIDAPHLNERVITNDIVELFDNNEFAWLGRFDNVINSGGVKIIPEKVEMEIQKVLDQLSITNRFFIIGIDDQTWGSKAILLIESEPEQINEVIMNSLNKKLSKYEMPKEIYWVPKFIETETKKIDRAKTVQLISLKG